ncbi:MAG: lycopene cyclase domain-containing protein [Candidatus Omnitrophica bacterium]|nr:lycopene cyclase domain-containing protein [Candidatus Omnitrophota bacterium]
MKEYTFFSLLITVGTILAVKRGRSGMCAESQYLLYLFFSSFWMVALNGYLTARRIVWYRPWSFLGFRIGSIPVENILIGFSIMTLTVLFWEKEKRRKL